LSITLSVKHTAAHADRAGPVFVSGRLLLDATGAKLFDWDDDFSLLVADDEACDAVRATLSQPGEYLGGALMQTWVRTGADGPELHTVYWLVLGDLERDPPSKWGPQINVRAIPPEYDYVR
jgi:hypothetical protein